MILELMLLHGFLLAAAGSLPIAVLPWFPIAIVVALVVIVVAALLYILAPVLNSGAMQQWARFQVYEALLSIGLILVFLGLVQLFLLNPQPSFASIGLVPQGCNTAAVNTIYTLSACDLAQFNTGAYTLGGYMWGYVFVKALIPETKFTLQPIPNLASDVNFQVTIPNLLDAQSGTVLTYIMDAILGFLLVSQLQLILLSSALFLLAFFFAIGLISRVFGVSRSFGGAMIAFGLGIGLVYPLVTSITYGFIDVSASTYCISSIAQTASCLLSSAGGAASAGTFQNVFFTSFLGPFSTLLSVFAPTTAAAATIPASIAWLFNEVGYIIAGLTLIPFMNIAIVDVFVTDFSRAVGEQMSFQMLFKGVI